MVISLIWQSKRIASSHIIAHPKNATRTQDSKQCSINQHCN
uniref:Uncharacterized protein n=1 Tax=Arundo donax TaxID=35708 RepID=A0A0A9U9S3_ARUDO